MKNKQPESSIIHSSIFRLTEFERKFLCPISMTIMENPITISLCGHTFQLSAIAQYISNKGQCPICKKQVTFKDLSCNYSLRTMIETYRKSIQYKQQLGKALELNQSQTAGQAEQAKQSQSAQQAGKADQMKQKLKLTNFMKDKSKIIKLNEQTGQKYTQNQEIIKNEGEQRQNLKSNTQVIDKSNVIETAINEYYKQTSIRIKKNNKNELNNPNLNNPNIPQFEYKINQLMSQFEIKEMAKKAFALFKLQTNQEQLKIMRKCIYIQVIHKNYMISWHYDNHMIKFGQYQLKQDHLEGALKAILNGYALVIKTGKWIQSGVFKNNIANGKGKFYHADGSNYQGDFKDHKPNGKGKNCFANGSTYQGDWKDDAFHGKGKYCYTDGSIYQGDWKNGKKTSFHQSFHSNITLDGHI